MKKTLLLTAIVLCWCTEYVHAQFDNYTWKTLVTTGAYLPREEADFINLDGKFYLIGGRGIQSISVYDPLTSTWTYASKPPIELHHFQAVAYKGEIYICCGMTGGYPHEKPLANFYIYNPKTDSWRVGPAIPADRQRGAGGAVLYKGNFYFACGILDGHWTGNVAWFDEYNPKKGEWKKLADAPTARDHFKAAVVGNKLYCIGGGQANAKDKKSIFVNEVDVYDFKTNAWRVAKAKLPTSRTGTATATAKNMILIMEGESNTQQLAHNEVEAYDVKADEFIKLPSLVTGRHAAGALFFNKAVYTAAGVGRAGGSPLLTSLECFSKDK